MTRPVPALAFAAGLAACLAPVWSVRYLPTQDGPSHLFNAMVMKDHGRPGVRYDEFFEVTSEPLPNLTAQYILVGLMHAVDPLTAEKLLVSLHIVAFAFSFRYFARSVNPGNPWAPLLGLAFVYNRCLWMGFYNYCLSLDVLWLCLGFVARRRDALRWRDAAALAALFIAAYFCHLLGFLLAAGAALVVAAAAERPARAAAVVLPAVLPAGALTGWYLQSTGFLASREADRLLDAPWDALRATRTWTAAVAAFEANLFGPPIDDVGRVGPWLLVGFGAAVLLSRLGRAPSPAPRPSRAWLVIAGLVSVGYLVAPDQLGPHGGFIQPRLALVLALLLAAVCPAPRLPVVRHLLPAAAALAVAACVANATRYAVRQNDLLAEFTAGIDAAGSGQAVLTVQPYPAELWSNPLWHAGSYYCLAGGNVDLTNYEAVTRHFSVRFRAPAARSMGPPGLVPLERFPLRAAVQTIVAWDVGPGRFGDDFRPVYSSGRLTIYQRR